tara:strand:+ start:202048 stop:203820 length:1773 start_codon:yes stop_codon:yes gene_type:complete
MSIHKDENDLVCFIGKHSKNSIRRELNEEKAELLALQQNLNAENAAGNDVSTIQSDIEKVKDSIESLTQKLSYNYVPLTNLLIKGANFGLEQTIKRLQAEIKDSISRRESPDDLEKELKEAQKSFDDYTKHLKGKSGKKYICEGCVNTISNALNNSRGVKTTTSNLPAVAAQTAPTQLSRNDIPSTKEIREFLNDYVIGQGLAKNTIASEVNEHYIKMVATLLGEGPEDGSDYKKSNILLIGPTGCGKTEIMRTLKKCLSQHMGKIPMVSESATKYTEAGYVGKDVDETINSLFRQAQSAVTKAAEESGEQLSEDALRQRAIDITQLGIVYIDEIDKISDDGSGAGGSVSRGGVQDALLSLIEGEVITIKLPTKQPGMVIPVDIDTSRMLFVASGAFSGGKGRSSIYDIVKKRTGKPSGEDASVKIGFNDGEEAAAQKTEENEYVYIQAADVVEYGLKSEVAGRFDLFATLENLRVQDLRRIMTEPKGAVASQIIEFNRRERDIQIEFTEEAYNTMAQQALDRGTGARALSGTVKHVVRSLRAAPELYAGKNIVIDADAVTDETKIQILNRESGKVDGQLVPEVELVKDM